MSTYTSTTMWGQITLGPNMEGSIAYIIWPQSHKRSLIWSSVRGPLWPQSRLIISISSVITSSWHNKQGFRAVDIASYSQHRPCHQGFKIFINHQSLTLGPIKINQKITFHVDLQWWDTTFIAFEWSNDKAKDGLQLRIQNKNQTQNKPLDCQINLHGLGQWKMYKSSFASKLQRNLCHS